VSRHEYESILVIYEAQNATQIADSQNAEAYAPERLAQARHLLERAKSFPKDQSSEIIATARKPLRSPRMLVPSLKRGLKRSAQSRSDRGRAKYRVRQR
jgi:hypothetical protein